MKNYIIILAAMMAMTTMNANAQSKEKRQGRSFTEKFNSAFNKTKAVSQVAADNAGMALNDAFNGRESKVDLIKVNGQYFMPLYDTNLYAGKDGQALASECQKVFYERYPKAQILTVAFPQTDWLLEPVMKGPEAVGFIRTLYCYIVARDVDGNLINARFSYKTYREQQDKVYRRLSANWPRWERTDHITPDVLKKLDK